MSGWAGVTLGLGNSTYVKRGASGDNHLLFSTTGNTGTMSQPSGVFYLCGSATAGVGIIVPFACTMTSFQISMSTLTNSSNSTGAISLYKNATVGGTKSFDVPIPSNSGNTPFRGAATGAVTLNGTSDYIVIAATCTAGTSIAIVGCCVAIYGTIT